jgi:glycosyltransferase involved in cell wall biosynthesis
MKIALISPLPPYRGGIAQFGRMLAAAFEERNCEVTGINYTHLYPGFLFPGKTQFEEGYSCAKGLVHSYQPFSWRKTRQVIINMNPDLVVSQWWHPFFAPCLSAIVPRSIKSAAVCHNIVPHESFPLAGMLSKHFFNRQNILAVHSKQAEEQALATGRKVVRLFHPVYDQYKKTGLPRQAARDRLGIKENEKALLFFGLVRDYKGLDILVEACGLLPGNYRIIAAGENYTNHSFDSSRLLWNNSYIPDSDVGTWFNAADMVVLPYRRASQSGIAQIALSFRKPLVVTDTGGLPETVTDGVTGTVAEHVTPRSIADAVLKCSSLIDKENTLKSIALKAEGFSWDSYAEKLLEAVS